MGTPLRSRSSGMIMFRNITLFGILLLLVLTIHSNNSVSCFSFDGTARMSPAIAPIRVSKMMSLRGTSLCYRHLGTQQTVRQARSAILRRMATVKPSTSILADPGSRKSESVMASLPDSLKPWFDLSLPEGRCIGFETTDELDSFPGDERTTLPNNHWLYSAFHKDEVDFGMQLKKTRNSFWLGRLALRRALDFPEYPVLKDDYGRPEMKNDFFGSISHKQDKGVAIVSPLKLKDPDAILAGIGIDLEMTSRPGRRQSLAKRILTETERESLGNLPGIDGEEEVLLRFSLKEAIYKAAHPLLNQYVSFQEAEVTPYPDGTASCTWLLDSNADQKIALLTAHWRKLEGDEYFLTSASVYTKTD